MPCGSMKITIKSVVAADGPITAPPPPRSSNDHGRSLRHLALAVAAEAAHRVVISLLPLAQYPRRLDHAACRTVSIYRPSGSERHAGVLNNHYATPISVSAW